MTVAEFVPQIAVVNCSVIRLQHQVLARHGKEHGQVGGARIVEAGDEAIDDVVVVLRPDEAPGEAPGGAKVGRIPGPRCCPAPGPRWCLPRSRGRRAPWWH